MELVPIAGDAAATEGAGVALRNRARRSRHREDHAGPVDSLEMDESPAGSVDRPRSRRRRRLPGGKETTALRLPTPQVRSADRLQPNSRRQRNQSSQQASRDDLELTRQGQLPPLANLFVKV